MKINSVTVRLVVAAICVCIGKISTQNCGKYQTESSCKSPCHWETPNTTISAFRHDYKYLNKIHYKTHPPMKWMRAVQICAAEGAILAHPSNDLEVKIMIELFTNKTIKEPVFWLGTSSIYSEEPDEKFLTLDGKSLIAVFQKWTKGYPDGDDDAKRCVIFRSKTFSMENIPCDERHRFVCYRRPNDNFEVTSISKGNFQYTSLVTMDGMIKVNERADVLNALQQCAREGSSLAVPLTTEEIPVYLYLMMPNKVYWVGLFDNFGEREFQNIDDTSIQYPYLNWTKGYPARHHKSFVVINSKGKYLNMRGENKNPFFCARDHQLTHYGDPTYFPRYTAELDGKCL